MTASFLVGLSFQESDFIREKFTELDSSVAKEDFRGKVVTLGLAGAINLGLPTHSISMHVSKRFELLFFLVHLSVPSTTPH